MQRHIEYDNVILLAIELEFSRVVALVAVEDQQLVFAFRTRCYIAVEVLDPIQAYCISSLAIFGGCNALVGQEVALGVLVSEVVLRSQDNEGGDGLAKGINALDHYCLFAVARLGQLYLAIAVRGCNYYACEDNAYHKPSLVEVVDIVVYDTILSLNVLYKRKLLANDLQIFILSPLVVVLTRLTRSDPFLAIDKVIGLELADRGRVAYVQQLVSYIFYTTQPGWKRSRIQLKDVLNNSLLFELGELLQIGCDVALCKLASASVPKSTTIDVVDLSCS